MVVKHVAKVVRLTDLKWMLFQLVSLLFYGIHWISNVRC